MPIFRKRPVTIQAYQWFTNGDHPQDDCHMVYPDPNSVTQFEPFLSEGKVVRRYRRPDHPDAWICPECGQTYLVHGFIDTKEGGHRVCPGDWIITGVEGEHYPCKPGIFEKTYDQVPEGFSGSLEIVPRPALLQFVGRMEAQLKANDHRGGWEDEGRAYLKERIKLNLADLDTLDTLPLDEKWRTALHRICADIANYAMMISDNCHPKQVAPNPHAPFTLNDLKTQQCGECGLPVGTKEGPYCRTCGRIHGNPS